MLEDRKRLKHAMLLSLVGAGLLMGSAGVVMSARALVVTAHADCAGLNCSSASDCGSKCFCNNPLNNSNGQCHTDDEGC
jgi:hypothetical protein